MKMDMSIEEIIKEYERIRIEDAKLFRAIRDIDDLSEVMRIIKADRSSRSGDVNELVYELLRVCGTRFVVQGEDMTAAMREVIYAEDYVETEFAKAGIIAHIEEQEIEMVEQVAMFLKGEEPTIPELVKPYANYMECYKALMEYQGDASSKENYRENIDNYRALVKELVKARRECMNVASYTKKCLPKEEWEYLTQEKLTYDKALEIAQELIDYGHLMCLSENEIAECDVSECDEAMELDAASIILNEAADNDIDENGNTPQAKMLREKYITNFLMGCGLRKEMLKSYYKKLPPPSGKGRVNVPNKKFIECLGIFVMPCYDIEHLNPSSTAGEKVEEFMRHNCMSMLSRRCEIFSVNSDLL